MNELIIQKSGFLSHRSRDLKFIKDFILVWITSFEKMCLINDTVFISITVMLLFT